MDSLPAEPQGKPKNTGEGSLFLHKGIFLTQELNWGLLHCRQIPYQLSYEGSLPPLANSASCGTNIHNPPSYRPGSSCNPLPEALPDIRALLGFLVPPRWAASFPVFVFSSHPDSRSVIAKPWVAFPFISGWTWFSLGKCLPWQVQEKHLWHRNSESTFRASRMLLALLSFVWLRQCCFRNCFILSTDQCSYFKYTGLTQEMFHPQIPILQSFKACYICPILQL